MVRWKVVRSKSFSYGELCLNLVNSGHPCHSNSGDMWKVRLANYIKVQPSCARHDDVIQWKHFPRYWPFVWELHRWPVNSLHKGQKRGALMFSLICAWINRWVSNRQAGDLRRHRTHYDVTGKTTTLVLYVRARNRTPSNVWGEITYPFRLFAYPPLKFGNG